MANNKNNKNGQSTSPFNRSNNIGNKSNQISELDLINVNADKAKKELGDVFSYVNDNLKSLNKTVNNDIYKNTKKIESSVKTVFDDLFKSLNKYSNRLDATLDKMNKLGTGISSNSVIASTDSSKVSKVVYDRAIFENATFNHSVFNDVIINEKKSGTAGTPEQPTGPRGTSLKGPTKPHSIFDDYDKNINKINNAKYGILSEEFDYQPGDISIPNNKWRMMVNKKRADLRPVYEKADFLTNHSSLMSTEKLTKLLSIKDDVKDIGKTLLNFAKPYWEKAKGSFEENYTKVAGLTSPEEAGTGGFLGINTGTDLFNELLDSTVEKYGSEAFSYSGEMIPAFTTALERGFKGPEAILKAQQDMVASKVLPWLDTQSDAWINMSFNMDKNSLDQVKNQQLLLKQSETGNRILQEGIANELTKDFAPMLTNIDTNLGIYTAKETMGEYYNYMQGLIDQGVNPQSAYAAVKDIMKAQQNPFEAVTSGNVSQILLGSQFGTGATVKEAFEYGLGPLLQQEASAMRAGDQFGTGAMIRAFGTDAFTENGWIQTVGKYSQGFGTSEYSKMVGDNSTSELQKQVDNISNYNTEDKKIQNAIENNVADISQAFKNAPTESISQIVGTLKEILTAVVSMALLRGAFGVGGGGGVGGTGAGLMNMGLIGALRSGTAGKGAAGVLGRFGSGVAGNGTVGVAGKIGAGLGKGGITAGGLSSATAVAAGLAGIGIGGYMGYQDAKSAIDDRKKWGVNSKTAAGIGGFFGGGEGGVSNSLSNAAKFGLIGAGIGSFIPVVGTVAGGAIGAGIGGLLGLAGGDNLSQMNQSIGDAFSGNGAGADGDRWTPHASGLTKVPSDNYKAVLHKDEMVATAKTANSLRQKGVTGKESSEKDISRKLNTQIDFSSVTSILEVISDKVSEATEKIAPKTKKLDIKFAENVDTNLVTNKK